MKTLATILTVLENEAEAKRFLLDVGVQGPSLHPRVHSESTRDRWNGWNKAMAVGTDAENSVVLIASHHYASGTTAFSSSRDDEMGRLGSLAFDDVVWPLQVLPAQPVVRHPEHTPTSEKSSA